MFASQGAAHGKEATGGTFLILFKDIDIGHQLHIANLEHTGIINQGAVNTTTVRTLDMHKLITTGLEGLLSAEVLHALGVLHLRHTDNGTANARQSVGTQLCQHTSHVLQFVTILQSAPFVLSVRQELIIVVPFVVTGIKEIFQIVESYSIE